MISIFNIFMTRSMSISMDNRCSLAVLQLRKQRIIFPLTHWRTQSTRTCNHI